MAEYIDRNLCELLAEYNQHFRLVVPLDKIEKLPVADVAPVVHGQWLIRFDAYKQEIDGFQCSVCGRREKEKEPYCHCGAKMDGGESSG